MYFSVPFILPRVNPLITFVDCISNRLKINLWYSCSVRLFSFYLTLTYNICQYFLYLGYDICQFVATGRMCIFVLNSHQIENVVILIRFKYFD